MMHKIKTLKFKYWLAVLFLLPTSLFAQNDEVETSELDELIIQIEKIDSKWTRIFKKPKFSDWSISSDYPISYGNQVVTKYTPNKDIQFNGISFLLLTAGNTTKKKKVLKPIVYKINSSGDTISLVSNDFIQIGDMESGISVLKKKGGEVAFEFNYTIEVNKDEPVYIGFEFVDTKEPRPDKINDVIIFGPLREKQKPMLETKIIQSKSDIRLYKEDQVFMNGLYFELKLLKN